MGDTGTPYGGRGVSRPIGDGGQDVDTGGGMIPRSTRVAVSDAVSSSPTSKSRPESFPSPRSSGSNSAKADAVGLTATVIDVGDDGAEGSGRSNPDS